MEVLGKNDEVVTIDLSLLHHTSPAPLSSFLLDQHIPLRGWNKFLLKLHQQFTSKHLSLWLSTAINTFNIKSPDLIMLRLIAAVHFGSSVASGKSDKEATLKAAQINQEDALNIAKEMKDQMSLCLAEACGLYLQICERILKKQTIPDSSLAFQNLDDSVSWIRDIGSSVSFIVGNEPSEALPYIAKLIVDYPKSPASVRFLLGLCFFQTSQTGRAIEAFKRALEMDPSHYQSLTALCFLQSPTQQGVLQSIHYLEKIINLRPNCTIALLGKANVAFMLRDFAKAEEILTLDQMQLTIRLKRINADRLYQLGRLRHAQENFAEARIRYEEVLKVLPNHGAARYNLAQCCIALGDFTSLEQTLQTMKSSFYGKEEEFVLLQCTADTFAVLDSHSKIEDKERFAHLAEQKVHSVLLSLVTACNEYPNNQPLACLKAILLSHEMRSNQSSGIAKVSDAWARALSLELVTRLRYTNSPTCSACASYLEVRAGIVPNESESVNQLVHLVVDHLSLLSLPIEILCELSVIAYRHRTTKCLLLFQQCVQMVQKEIRNSQTSLVQQKFKAQYLVILLNYAIACENLGRLSKASNVYKKLNGLNPNFVEAHLRQAAVALERGNMQRAQKYAELALQDNPKSTKCRLLQAEVHLAANRLEKAISTAKDIKGNVATTLAATLCYKKALLFHMDATSLLGNAKKLCMDALQQVPGNWVAANGLAVFLAEQGQLDAALDLLRYILGNVTSSQGSSNQMSSGLEADLNEGKSNVLWVLNFNLALVGANKVLHERTSSNEPPGSSQETERVLRHLHTCMKIRPLDRNTFLLLGRILYDFGRLRECLSILEKARRFWPDDILFRHNYAMAVASYLPQEMTHAAQEPPEKIEQCAALCQEMLSIHRKHAALKARWKSFGVFNPEVVRSVKDGTMPLRKLGDRMLSESVIKLPPKGIERLPDHTVLESLAERGELALKAICKMIPEAYQKWQQKRMDEEKLLREKQQEHARKNEVSEKEREHTRLEEKRLEIELQNEAETYADVFPSALIADAKKRNPKERKRDDELGEEVDDTKERKKKRRKNKDQKGFDSDTES
eukprot:GHVP01033069.1.p1 GENE.GHVP01033069.1~~GHVP01033069.1.p1  ORF type:complete len:1078 (+),score=211.42 GHVP01033069.1:36-3269(+)